MSKRTQKRLNPTSPEVTDAAIAWLKSMTREELAEWMTTYEPGVPHYWLGQPVEPITKEELLAAFGGTEQEESAAAAKAA